MDGTKRMLRLLETHRKGLYGTANVLFLLTRESVCSYVFVQQSILYPRAEMREYQTESFYYLFSIKS